MVDGEDVMKLYWLTVPQKFEDFRIKMENVHLVGCSEVHAQSLHIASPESGQMKVAGR